MEINFTEEAQTDFLSLDKQLQLFFKNHIDKLQKMPPRRHLQKGIPYFMEDITKQARLVYTVDENAFFVFRCFATQKEYEKWYKSYRS